MVVNDLWVGAVLGEGFHGGDEVFAVADDPAGAEDVVPGDDGYGEIAGCFGLSVDSEGVQGCVLRCGLGVFAVVDVVAGNVDEGDVGSDAAFGQLGDAGGVDCPGLSPSGFGFGGVDLGVGGGVDDGADSGEVQGLDRAGAGEVEILPGEEGDCGVLSVDILERSSELSVGPEHESASWRHRRDVFKERVGFVCFGDDCGIQGDGPLDAQGGVGEVHEGVLAFGLRGPVVVDQVGVQGAWIERLEGVADTAGNEDGRMWRDFGGEHRAEGVSRAKIDPGSEHSADTDGDKLVPGFCVDSAGDADYGVVGHVVLDGAEVREPGVNHFGALPVFLEPSTRILVHG